VNACEEAEHERMRVRDLMLNVSEPLDYVQTTSDWFDSEIFIRNGNFWAEFFNEDSYSEKKCSATQKDIRRRE